MPELKEHRQDPAPARRKAPASALSNSSLQTSSPWGVRAASWLRSTTETLTRTGSGRPIVDRFAEMAAQAREPEEVRVELVRLAWSISGAARVELYSDREGRAARRLACWPPSFPNETSTESRSTPRGPIAGEVARSIKEHQGPQTLQVPLRAGDTSLGFLRLTASDRRPWTARLVSRLGTLCAIASTAERGLWRPDRGGADPSYDPSQGPHGSTILAAFLSFAQAQARRRHESLSLLEIAVDRLDSIKELLGDELADAALERVTRTIKATIRASDIVARLEDGRIAVLLPNATPEDAMKVAEAARMAIARAGSTTMPALTASIGLATYPDHAHDVATLRAAACSSLTKAKKLGHDQIVTASPIPASPSPVLAHCMGWNKHGE